ncbi:MAG: CHAT domain-containing protein [Bryobacteraceae bacterium]
MRLIPFFVLFLTTVGSLPLRPQDRHSPQELLDHALHLADLYNWDDAGEEFAEAEKLFVAVGDGRNALYAKLGKIRSTIDQRDLPATSAQLASDLEQNPLLQNDKQLRLFCLIVKGDIDGEIDARAMREDWEEVQKLAKELGIDKWQYRALAQLGVAAFYNGDLDTAGKNVARALVEATKSGDGAARVVFLTMLGIGLRESHMNEDAMTYFNNALKIASTIPDTEYPFFTKEALLENLIDVKQADAAQKLADEILAQAQQRRHPQAQAIVLTLEANIAKQRHDDAAALRALQQVMALSKAGGFIRELADAQALASDIYRDRGELERATEFADLAATSTQESGDTWSVPRRLLTVAMLDIKQGKYDEADRVFERASTFVDALIGDYSSVLEKTAVIKASSELYSQHFALVADRFNDPAKAYSVIEQVRGRVTTDLLMAGAVAPAQAKKDERAISELRLKLAVARSTSEVRQIRDQIFLVEQARWITPEISILKAQPHDLVGMEQVQRSLDPSAIILEYVVADPRSYCLVISRTDARIVPLADRQSIEALIAAYLKAVKAKAPASKEGRALYDALLAPVPTAMRKAQLVVVRDGPLYLVPFDGFIDNGGRYVAETHSVIYEPSATSFYLLTSQPHRPTPSAHALLAVGGVPYSPAAMKQASITRGYDPGALGDLPASKDEVIAAEAALHGPGNLLLIGPHATESEFKRAATSQYGIIHLAVHGYASTTERNRSALVLLSDPPAGEDGFLQASEIVQLPLNSDLVILSACDTAVGPIEGEEGIAALSSAFLLAGARSVVSTLWSIDDTFSLFLMKQFYNHLAAHETVAAALTAAKRDMLRKYGSAAVPYYWAGFTLEGAANLPVAHHD